MRASHMSGVALPATLIFLFVTSTVAQAFQAVDEFEKEPILYSTSSPENRVSALKTRIETGDLTLARTPEHGYLPALLEALDVPVESQTLVFSKTSLPRCDAFHRALLRAIYFNDDVYVGFCQSGDVLEISAVDSKLGTVFYSLDQHSPEKPVIQRTERKAASCVTVHPGWKACPVISFVPCTSMPEVNLFFQRAVARSITQLL